VNVYNHHSAVVELGHDGKRVCVDVSLLASDIQLASGEWINVIGYVEKQGASWIVKAILAWPVSPGFNLIQYEKIVTQRMSSIL